MLVERDLVFAQAVPTEALPGLPAVQHLVLESVLPGAGERAGDHIGVRAPDHERACHGQDRGAGLNRELAPEAERRS